MKRILAMLLATIMVLSLAACGGGGGNNGGASNPSGSSSGSDGNDSQPSDSGDVTLTFWSWLPTNDQSDAIIKGFEDANPGIKIEYTRTEQDDFFEKLQVAMASGTGPDLFGMTTGPMMEQYANFSADM